ncbi:prepilin-type N-terminal cleavage/methylation domain-containing protein [bacterium]|nr:prepilin-type N-terminal cleavage/methylation domain-containing protein [bacterium]
MINSYKNNKGFTLLEIAVSIFIVSLGVLGILGLINYSMQAEIVSRNELVASQLAQEGLELVRNIRDNNWLNSVDWTDGIIDYNTYTIDYNKNIVTVSNIEEDDAKLFLDSDGFYFHGGATSTNFSRLITIKDEDTANTPPEYFTVESNVLWRDQKGTHEYKAETKLYNWR